MREIYLFSYPFRLPLVSSACCLTTVFGQFHQLHFAQPGRETLCKLELKTDLMLLLKILCLCLIGFLLVTATYEFMILIYNILKFFFFFFCLSLRVYMFEVMKSRDSRNRFIVLLDEWLICISLNNIWYQNRSSIKLKQTIGIRNTYRKRSLSFFFFQF